MSTSEVKLVSKPSVMLSGALVRVFKGSCTLCFVESFSPLNSHVADVVSMRWPRISSLPRYCLGGALCDGCGRPVTLKGTHLRPNVDLCRVCFDPIERRFLKPSASLRMTTTRRIIDMYGLLATAITWSQTDSVTMAPGESIAKFWRAVSRSTINDIRYVYLTYKAD